MSEKKYINMSANVELDVHGELKQKTEKDKLYKAIEKFRILQEQIKTNQEELKSK